MTNKNIVIYWKTASIQIAHLVFSDTQANQKKPKEQFFQHSSERKNKKASNQIIVRRFVRVRKIVRKYGNNKFLPRQI